MGQSEAAAVGLVTIWYRATAAAIDQFAAELQALRYPQLQPVFVIHAQTPEEVRRLQAAVPGAWIIQPGANLGPAAGWNLAIRCLLEAGSTDYIGICNTDTHLDPDCIARLVAVMQRMPHVGACQPLLCAADAPERVQMFGGSLDLRSGLAHHDYKGHIYSERLPAVRDADYLDGGSILLRASVLRRVGGFDERLFMYAEDCDLSLRIRGAGYRTVAVRDARAWHAHPEGPGSLPPAYEVFYRGRNRFWLVRRYGSARAWRLLMIRALLWELPRGVLFYLRRGRRHLARAHAMGILAGLGGRRGFRGWLD